jgi:hypothetical protein
LREVELLIAVKLRLAARFWIGKLDFATLFIH